MDQLSKFNGNADENDWPKYEEYVLHEIKALRVDLKDHIITESKELKELHSTVTELKTKIAVWGAIIGGAVTIAQPLVSSAMAHILGR